MGNNRIYTVVKPALHLSILKAELTDTSIDTYSSKDGIQDNLIDRFPYSEISSINISLIDVNRNQILIKSDSGKKLSLINLSMGKLTEGKIRRANINQSEEFDMWISELHKILVEKKLSYHIKFSEGSNSKTVLLVLLLVFCFIAMIAAFSIGLMGPGFTLIGGSVVVATFLFKMGVKKDYIPEGKILE